MIMLIDLNTALLHQRELLHEAHRAQRAESLSPRPPSRVAQLWRALTSWLTRPLDDPMEEDHPWPRLQHYPYGPRQ
jgi:hypothetical protein